MASMTISASKKGPSSVPQPNAHASFALGSRPAVLRAPALDRIKPAAQSTRDYGKAAPPLAGTTGMTGLS